MDKCEQCKRELKSYQCVSLGSNGKYQELCQDCHNAIIAEKWGIQKPFSDFPPMVFEDSEGQSHTFIFSTMLNTGLAMTAHEVSDGKVLLQGGYRFGVLEHPEANSKLTHEKLCKKIEAGLAQKYLEPSESRLAYYSPMSITKNDVVGRIEEPADLDDNDDPLAVVIDGKSYSWLELGHMIKSYIGFNFRLDIHDISSDDLDYAHRDEDDSLWWLNNEDEINCEDK